MISNKSSTSLSTIRTCSSGVCSHFSIVSFHIRNVRERNVSVRPINIRRISGSWNNRSLFPLYSAYLMMSRFDSSAQFGDNLMDGNVCLMVLDVEDYWLRKLLRFVILITVGNSLLLGIFDCCEYSGWVFYLFLSHLAWEIILRRNSEIFHFETS